MGGEVRGEHPTTQLIVLKPMEVEKDPKGGSTPRLGNNVMSGPSGTRSIKRKVASPEARVLRLRYKENRMARVAPTKFWATTRGCLWPLMGQAREVPGAK